MADARECYIPLAPDPERRSRSLSIWQESAARLGLGSAEPLNGEYRLGREDGGGWNLEGRAESDDD